MFDLDGTLIPVESIPYVAMRYGLGSVVGKLTNEACRFATDYEANLRKRVSMFELLSIDDVSSEIERLQFRPMLEQFVKSKRGDCCVVSSNMDCWCRPLVRRLGCESFFSEAEICENQISGIKHVLKKDDIVRDFQSRGYRTVFIGDAMNDLAAMAVADFSVAVAFSPVRCLDIERHASVVAFSESELVGVLENICHSSLR